jgi:2-oxoisovalerate dehydrogenase E1 component alpha subunit
MADFSYLDVPPAGSVARPETDTDPAEMRGLAYGLIRVLDDNGNAVGAWAPKIESSAVHEVCGQWSWRVHTTTA